MQRGWLKPLLAWSGFLLLALLAIGVNARKAETVRVGKPLPPFSLTSLEGTVVTSQDLRGKPAFLNFWATWCPPCREEMPAIAAVSRQYEGKATVLAVNRGEAAPVVRDFLVRNGYSLSVVLDRRGALFSHWGLFALPTSIFVDAGGVVCGIFDGTIEQEVMMRELGRAARGC